MAIAKMKKLEIIGLMKDKDQFLRLLQKLGLVQLINMQSQDQAFASSPQAYAGINLLAIEEAISFLASFSKEKSAPFLGMVKFKPRVYQKELQEVINNFDCQNALKELSLLENELKDISQHKERLVQERKLLAPWQNLAIRLDELHGEQHCAILLGSLNSRDYPSLSQNLAKEQIKVFIDMVAQDRANMHLAIVYLRQDFEQLDALLKNCHFSFITLTRHKCTVEERLLEIDRESSVFDDQNQELKNHLQGLASQQFQLMMVYDYLKNIIKTQRAEEDLAKQEFTFMLRGWIREKDAGILEKELCKNFQDFAIFISEPKEEAVPVILENKKLIQPFEFITNIYGMPRYNEIDPTPYLAPFFFLYFGFCVSDVGYGLLLVLISYFALKRFRLGPQGLRFFRLFLFCGISTIIVGALTGSWFGNLFDLLAQTNQIFSPLKKLKDSLVMLDSLKEPTKLLGIALSFGIIQVWFGNIIAAIGNIKNKRYLDVVLDQVPMLTFLFGLTGLGLIFLKLLNGFQPGLFKYAALLGALMLTLTQGRSEKSLGGKLFYGIYNLYNSVSGYLSDVLSYSRLWALGLVTGVMASTVNLISIQFSQIFVSLIPSINKISLIRILVSTFILITIFLLGHIASFLMNLLGAFVHPVRLQFVEFFSKFFKSGGTAFKPLKIETKYINIQ